MVSVYLHKLAFALVTDQVIGGWRLDRRAVLLYKLRHGES